MKQLNDIINLKVAEIKKQFSTPVKTPYRKNPGKQFVDGMPTEDEIREYLRQVETGSPGQFSLVDYAKWILDRNSNHNNIRKP